MAHVQKDGDDDHSAQGDSLQVKNKLEMVKLIFKSDSLKIFEYFLD